MTATPSSGPSTKTSSLRPSDVVTVVSAMLGEVVEVERTKGVLDLRLLQPAEVVQARVDRLDVRLGLAELAGRGLRGGQRLQQPPEEARVGAAQRDAHRPVVELVRVQLIQFFASRHIRCSSGNGVRESGSVAARVCA